jgi:succinyl-CoA synthetase alpha subunit
MSKGLIILMTILILFGGLSMANALTDNEQELLNALQIASQYLETSNQSRSVVSIYIPPAQALRSAAEAMEQKDKDIETIRKVIMKYRGGNQ